MDHQTESDLELKITPEISKNLELLEIERLNKVESYKKVWKILIPIIILVIVIAVLSKIYFLMIISFIGIVGGFIYQYSSVGKFKSEFKRKVVQSLFEPIPNITYKAEKSISLHEFRDSNLYNSRIDRFSGEDLFEGLYGETIFRFSEIKAEQKHVSTDSKGNRRESWVTIYDGLFLIADFNKNLTSETRVFNRSDGFFEKMFNKKTKVVLESVNFEEVFNTYSDDQVEARYILSPSMMERMLELQKYFDHKIHFSFKGEHVYIAIETYKDFFEPNIKVPLNKDQVERIYGEFVLCLSILDILELNTRIWSKD